MCIRDSPKEVILETETPNLYLLPTNTDLVAIELEIVNLPDRDYRMKAALDKIKGDYDFIIIDLSLIHI